MTCGIENKCFHLKYDLHKFHINLLRPTSEKKLGFYFNQIDNPWINYCLVQVQEINLILCRPSAHTQRAPCANTAQWSWRLFTVWNPEVPWAGSWVLSCFRETVIRKCCWISRGVWWITAHSASFLGGIWRDSELPCPSREIIAIIH